MLLQEGGFYKLPEWGPDAGKINMYVTFDDPFLYWVEPGTFNRLGKVELTVSRLEWLTREDWIKLGQEQHDQEQEIEKVYHDVIKALSGLADHNLKESARYGASKQYVEALAYERCAGGILAARTEVQRLRHQRNEARGSVPRVGNKDGQGD